MARHFFGTDGIRGRVGVAPMTVDFALRLSNAAAQALAPTGGLVLIGKDTRISGYMFESALEAGFLAVGIDVWLTGPLPTPGIAYLTKKLGADFGIVISASHNFYEDNGIKFFDREGEKLSDALEDAIEGFLENPPRTLDSRALGQATHLSSARSDYMEFCKSTIPEKTNLGGLKIVVDAAHGAGYKVAPRAISDLGAEVIPVGCSPNGRNINDGCGSTRPDLLKMTVSGVRANVGLALDGDGDRLLMVDEDGNLVDGDKLLYILALDRIETKSLRGPIVGTVMSNLGLELALREVGVEFLRAKVGDRHVLEMLKKHRGMLGGEASGHLICLDKTTTGDGLVVALQILSVIQRTGKTLKELASGMKQFPQTLINVPINKSVDIEMNPAIRDAVKSAEQELSENGRVVLRASGTEMVIRVMVEGEDADQVSKLAEKLAQSVRVAGGAPGGVVN